MKINFRVINLELTPEVREVIEEKIGSLSKFISRIKMPVEAFVEVSQETQHHQKGKVYYVEVNLELPGKILRAEAKEENIYKAVNVVKDELKILLKKYKEKK